MHSVRNSILSGQNLGVRSPLLTAKSRRGSETDDLTSVAIAREITRTVDQRGEDRHRLIDERVRIRFAGEEIDAELINFSEGGAMIAAPIRPNLWDRVDLLFNDDHEIETAVVWVRKGRCGLEFAHETQLRCSPDLQEELLRRVLSSDALAKVAPAPTTVAPVPTEPVEVHRRSSERHPLIWSGVILYQHDIHKVRLRNISATGALVESQSSFPTGSEVFFDLGEAGTLFAEVNWGRGNQYGLSFKEPFDISRLALLTPQITAPRAGRPNSDRDQNDADCPWAPRWNRASVGELRRKLGA